MDFIKRYNDLKQTLINPPFDFSEFDSGYELYKERFFDNLFDETFPYKDDREWIVTLWEFYIFYMVTRQKIDLEIDVEFKEIESQDVSLDEDPVSAGLNILVGKVSIVRQYSNRATFLHSKAIKKRSEVDRFYSKVSHICDLFTAEVSALIALSPSYEGTSAKERENISMRRTAFAHYVNSLWKSLQADLKAHTSIIKEKMTSLSQTRSDFLTQLSALKVLSRMTNDTLGRSLGSSDLSGFSEIKLPREMSVSDKNPRLNNLEEGEVSYG